MIQRFDLELTRRVVEVGKGSLGRLRPALTMDV